MTATRKQKQLSPDEFIGQVIGIGYMRIFQIHLPPYATRKGDVAVTVMLEDPADPLQSCTYTVCKPTTGLALSEIREQIRKRFGQ